MFNRLDYTISQLNKNKTVLKQLNWLKKYIVEYPLARYYVTDTVTTSTGGIAFVPRGSVETPYDIPVHEGDLIFAPHIEGTPIYIVTDVSDPVEYTVSLLGYMQGPQGVQGPIGPQGPTGPQGPQGEQGPRGFTGFGMYISTNTSLSSSTTQISISDVVEPQDRILLGNGGDIIIGVNSPNVPMFISNSVANGIVTVTFYGYMGSTLSVDSLFELIEGSETVVVDLNEEGTALEVHLDASVMAKINRALLQPVSAPTEDSVVVVTPQNEQSVVPVSQIGGGGSGKLYLHHITLATPVTHTSVKIGFPDSFPDENISTLEFIFSIYSTNNTPITLLNLADILVKYFNSQGFIQLNQGASLGITFVQDTPAYVSYILSSLTFIPNSSNTGVDVGFLGSYVNLTGEIGQIFCHCTNNDITTISISDTVVEL